MAQVRLVGRGCADLRAADGVHRYRNENRRARSFDHYVDVLVGAIGIGVLDSRRRFVLGMAGSLGFIAVGLHGDSRRHHPSLLHERNRGR